VRFLDIIQGLRNLAVREGIVSQTRARRLAQGERLIQELRRRLLTALLEASEDGLNLKAELGRALDELELPSPEEE
jgi:hypothetical protein